MGRNKNKPVVPDEEEIREPKDVKELWEIIKNQEKIIQELLKKLESVEASQINMADSHEELIRVLEKDLTHCDQEVVTLQEKLSTLQGKFTMLESELKISQHVTQTLSVKLDDTNQYSRRNCLILNNIKAERTDLKNYVQKIITEDLGLPNASVDIDRIHRIGPIDAENQTQPTIVKFKSFTERTNVYKARSKTRKMKVSLNLTNRRSNLLKTAREMSESYPNINFIFVDENCQLKIRLHEKVKGKLIHSFNTLQDLAQILGLLEFHEAKEISDDLMWGDE